MPKTKHERISLPFHVVRGAARRYAMRVSCTTDAHFVPLTAANLIKLGVAKNADDITLTPDWALISGLLAGVAFMIFG